MFIPILRHLAAMGETWLLLPADYAHNDYMREYLKAWCHDIVSIGRISWEENGKNSTENFAWYRFDGTRPSGPITYHPPR